jgi:heterodisulfide reductase subunit C
MKMAAENIPDPIWKKSLVDEVGESLNLCFQCGTCTSSCPSGRTTAFRTRQVIRMAQFGLKDQILPSDDLWHCTTCYTCYERCPRGVEIVGIITLLRNRAVQGGFISDDHARLVRGLYKGGHLVPITDKVKKERKALGLEEVPNTVLKDKEALKQVQSIIDGTGLERMVRGD